MSTPLRLLGPFRTAARRALAAAALVGFVLAAVVVSCCSPARRPRPRRPPTQPLQMVSDECHEVGPATPC